MSDKLRRRIGLFVCLALAFWTAVCPAYAEAPQAPDDGQIKSILEKSLSIVEIDKEIARVADEQAKLGAKLESARTALAGQEKRVSQKREDAGRVLRAYYTGDRDVLLTALFSADSLSHWMAVLDYFDTIFSADRQTLNGYLTEYRKLKSAVADLNRQSAELAGVQTQLQTQRQRVLELQRDVDSSVDSRPDADRLKQMIREMTDYWQNVGIGKVRIYFQALDDAMSQLPQWIQDNRDMLRIDGFTYTLTIPDDKLNAFLRNQNKLFDNFSFAFVQDAVVVSGRDGNLSVKLTGHYTIDPKGTIVFHVDELLFNGLALPDTTRQSLEQEFDLNFYPQSIISFLRTKSVQVEDGKLIVQLSVSL
ncbi:coiled-coil domain-containing protein [Paenibacillus humicola]|uniref:coiled-coil domain-containing protein n=1 Tax=Paenibacillus humicola TaxID=3110540 RepID=UPI00237A3098|nr:hypothetical protein [Paenibacillus humicola]